MNEEGTDETKPVSQLLIESQSSLYAFIYSLLGRREDASDVLQEANLAILAKEDEYDPTRSFISWACRFAHLQVLAYRTRKGRDRLWCDAALIDSLAAEIEKNMLESDVRLRALASCVKRLKPQHQSLIKEVYEKEQSYTEIGQKLGKTAATLNVTMHRIRKRLFECIKRTVRQESDERTTR